MTVPQDALRRLFVVGCPRSGTTLLQALMVRHARVTTVPETHFFAVAFGRSWLPLEAWPARRALRRAVRSTGLSVTWPRRSRLTSRRPYVEAFIRALDERALSDGSQGWLEKTPRHVFHVGHIGDSVPRAQFVHLIRDGRATVASLYDVARRNPNGIWQRYRSLEYCVERWNRSVSASLTWRGRPGHHLLRYEDVTRDSASAISGLCRAIGLTYLEEPRDLAKAPAIYRPHETWKAAATLEVYDYGLAKYEQLFDARQRRQIEAGLMQLPELGAGMA